MKVFISWSGPASNAVAMSLRAWLPRMFRGLEPFVSSADIDRGARWASELDQALEATDFGIICLTATNLRAPWILYEAGALSKSVVHSRVATVVLGIEPSQIDYPLAKFQGTRLERDDFLGLVVSMNRWLGESRYVESDLEHVFNRLWPDLEVALDSIAADSAVSVPPPVATAQRSDGEILEELVSTVRRIAQVVDLGAEPTPRAETRRSDLEAPILRRNARQAK